MAAPCRGRFLLNAVIAARHIQTTPARNILINSVPVRCLSVPTNTSSTGPSAIVGEESSLREKKISTAMKVYLEKTKQHDAYMQKEIIEYELGKRHLANIMGVEDPDNFSQTDIDKAISYLLPSGLYDKAARPMMKHPEEVIPKRLAAQFAEDGRPFHHLFYTGSARFYMLMQNMGSMLDSLKELEDRRVAIGQRADEANRIQIGSTRWMTQEELNKVLQEKISDPQYAQFVTLVKRVVEQPYAFMYSKEILQYRVKLREVNLVKTTGQIEKTEDGKSYVTSDGGRKAARAKVKVWPEGSGVFTVNGQELLPYFPNIEDRNQIAFPLVITNMLGSVDVEAEVEFGGSSGQAGAIRLALSRSLAALVDEKMVTTMRMAGLLTRDPRRRERKKYGQRGAREKFTWKAR